MVKKENVAREETLKRSVERLETLMDEIPVGVANIDIKGKITYFNKRFEEISGYSREEIVSKNAFKLGLFSPETLKLLGRRIKERLIGKPLGPLQIQLKRKDGKWMWLEERAKLLKERGVPVGLQAIGQDITERKREEEALRQSEEKLRLMFEALPEGITVIDIDGKIVQSNKATAYIYGYDNKEEIIGLSIFEFIAEKDRTGITEIMKKTLKEGSLGAIELTQLRKDRSEFPAEVNGTVLKDASGNPIGFITITEDITERKQMEQEIQDKNEQLEIQNEELRATDEELHASNEELQATNEKLRDAQEKLVRSERLAAIGQLAGGVGHELRNPLSAIKNAVYYVRGKVAKNELAQKEPRVIEFLDIVDEEINSSNKIINDLLGFSRVGKPTVLPTRIERVIEDALSYTILPENIALTKKLNTGLPEIKIDTNQVCQVLVNVILNAVQAMPTGGKLTISAQEKDKFLEVEIADTGCGIPQEVMDKIFDPLFTTRAKGIGLGLAVCKTIIDRHQGHIGAESKVGKGATFTIKLPLEAEQ